MLQKNVEYGVFKSISIINILIIEEIEVSKYWKLEFSVRQDLPVKWQTFV